MTEEATPPFDLSDDHDREELRERLQALLDTIRLIKLAEDQTPSETLTDYERDLWEDERAKKGEDPGSYMLFLEHQVEELAKYLDDVLSRITEPGSKFLSTLKVTILPPDEAAKIRGEYEAEEARVKARKGKPREN